MAPVNDEIYSDGTKGLTLASITTRWGKNGFPSLPDSDVIQDGGLPYKKVLVGKFISDNYGASPIAFQLLRHLLLSL